MSRATIRAQAATYLTGGAVAGLSTVHSAKPVHWKPSEWRFDGTSNQTANGYIHIEHVEETREALGKRFLRYTVALVLVFRSRDTGPTAGEDRMGGFDTLIDAIKARLRDKSGGPLGDLTQAIVWEAAEHLLEDEADLPQDQAPASEIWGLVRFDASEWING